MFSLVWIRRHCLQSHLHLLLEAVRDLLARTPFIILSSRNSVQFQKSHRVKSMQLMPRWAFLEAVQDSKTNSWSPWHITRSNLISMRELWYPSDFLHTEEAPRARTCRFGTLWTFCEDPENPSPDLEDWPGTCQLVHWSIGHRNQVVKSDALTLELWKWTE